MANIIITGTSRGIGKELALKFANAGNKVLALSRSSTSSLEENGNVTYISIDIGNEKELTRIKSFLDTNWKKVDAIVHNAGILINKPFAELSLSDFETVYKTNVFGMSCLTRVCLPYLSKGSHVVTISSMGGVQGSAKFAGLAAYSSSKAAVITLSELLAEEYKEDGISFNVLALGAVQTEMLNEAFPGYKAPLTATEMADYIYDFTLNGNKYFNGKTLQVSSTTP